MENTTSSENNGRVVCQKRFIQLFRWLCVRFAPLPSLFDLHSSLKPWILGSDRKPSEISYFRKYQVAPCHFQPELIRSQWIWTATDGILAVRPTLIQSAREMIDFRYNRSFSFNHPFSYTLSVPCSVPNLLERNECTHLTQEPKWPTCCFKNSSFVCIISKGKITFGAWNTEIFRLRRRFRPPSVAGTLPIWYTYNSTFCWKNRIFQNMQRFGTVSWWTKFGFNLSQRRKNELQILKHHERE